MLAVDVEFLRIDPVAVAPGTDSIKGVAPRRLSVAVLTPSPDLKKIRRQYLVKLIVQAHVI